MKRILNYLNQPYPRRNDKKAEMIGAFCIFLFIFLFLFIFQPFGLNRIDNSKKVLVFFNYSVITFIVTLFNLFLFPKLVEFLNNKKKEKPDYTLKDEILKGMWIIFTIGLANSVYTYWIGYLPLTFKAIIHILFYTLAIGIFPATIAIIINFNFMLSHNLKTAISLNQKLRHPGEQSDSKLLTDDVVTLISDNKKEKIDLNVSNILFIKSEGNYIEIYYRNQDEIENTLLRSTLKRIEEMLKDSRYLFRCHRAYIVNVNNIQHVEGNSQGYKLRLTDTDYEIPASRSYSKKMKELLMSVN